MTDDIDVITSAITGDKQAVIKEQLGRIQRELIERRAINIQHREALHELITDVRNDILQTEPAQQHGLDDLRHERYLLKREWRQLVLHLLAEQRSCWNDIQALNAEARQAEKELLALTQRDRRLRDFT